MSKESKLFLQWQQALKDNPSYTKELEEIQGNQEEIIDRFYTDLTFGTAGLRGIIGLGTNRMNIFTVGKATQGLAEYALSQGSNPSVAIGYDSRNFSREFAEHASSILAANNIIVYLYPRLAPTPAVAFAVRELDCDFGIVITASHNPKEYNGYKVFASDGCQIDDDVATEVLKKSEGVDIFNGVKIMDLGEAIEIGLINYISEGLTDKYLRQVFSEALKPELCKQAKLNVVYTPLNGTGNIYVRRVLEMLEIEDVSIVKEQEHPDGNFPTAPYPNPEFKEALALGLKLAEEKGADVLLATDPDADRIAMAVRHGNSYQIVNGNQLGILLLDYIASTRKELGTLPDSPVAVRSIVSSKLTDKVANSYGVDVIDVLTGFKFVGEAIGNLEDQGEIQRFIFAFEEACGYLIGTHVRDKDAVVTAVIIAEMISYLKLNGKTAIDRYGEISEAFGFYSNMTQNLVFAGAEGMDQMTEIMDTLRRNPPQSIVGRQIRAHLDYLTSTKLIDGEKHEINTRPSNVLEYHLEDGCGIIIRPSGTEPKLKIYYSLVGKNQNAVNELEKQYSHASVELAGVEV